MIRIFNHHFNAHAVLSMCMDFLFVLLATISFGAIDAQGTALSTTLGYSLSLAAWTPLAGNVAGLYEPVPGRSLQHRVSRALLAVLLMLPVAFAIFSLLPGQIKQSALMPYVAMAAVLGVIAHRSLVVHFGRSSLLRRRILVLGTGRLASQVSESLRFSDPQAVIVGFVPGPNEQEHVVPPAMVMPASGSLASTAQRARVDEVIVALAERRSGSMSLRDLLDCKISGIRVSDISTHFERQHGQIRLDYVNAGWLVFGDGFNQGFLRTAIKRLFDILCAITLLLLTLPLMLVTMFMIVMDSRGPVFYRQERVGLNGRTFNVLKFRSMRCDAEQDGRPRWAGAADDRVTRVGRLIRMTRIDELPQLCNVLKGEMSMVGPRPERPFFVDSLTNDVPYYAVRHSIKPGVTGWAQVRYQYGSSVDDAKQKLQYDLYYVKNHTLFLDLLIMFETVSVVLTGKGAR
jgi:sugar transferase (PEP-CTERM system associated)